MAKKFRFSLEGRKGCSVKSFTLKETSGADEALAAEQKAAKGARATVFEELVRASIHAVDDQLVTQPYLEYDLWNSRTRAFALKAFVEVNGIEEDETSDFLSNAEVLAE
jgi:hypothetical protein